MSDIASITLPDNTTYDLKDKNSVGGISFSGHALSITSRGGTSSSVDIGTFDTLKLSDGENDTIELSGINGTITATDDISSGGHIQSQDDLDPACIAKNLTTDVEAQLLSNLLGTHGIYSNGWWDDNNLVYHSDPKWLVSRDNVDGSITLNGNAETATKLATSHAITIGNKSLNFDGSAALTYTLSDIGAVDKSVLGTFVDVYPSSAATVTMTNKDTYYKVGTAGLTLTAGTWLICATLQDLIDADSCAHTFMVYTSNSAGGAYKITAKQNISGTGGTYSKVIFCVTLSASATYYGWLASTVAGKSGSCWLWMRAVRLK